MQSQCPPVEKTLWKYSCVYLAQSPEESVPKGPTGEEHWFWSWNQETPLSTSYMIVGKLISPPGTSASSSVTRENDSIYFIGPLWRINELLFTNCLGQCLAHSIVRVALAIAAVMFGQNEPQRGAWCKPLRTHTSVWQRRGKERAPSEGRTSRGARASPSQEPCHWGWPSGVALAAASFSSWGSEPGSPSWFSPLSGWTRVVLA